MHESTSLPRSATGAEEAHALLRDFRTDSRMLVLVALAIPVGVVSALVAKALLWLIAEITDLVFFQRFGPLLPPLENHHLGAWIIAAPVVGALLIGLMARYGSEKIRGHGVPEALEAGQTDLVVAYPDKTLYNVIAKLLQRYRPCGHPPRPAALPPRRRCPRKRRRHPQRGAAGTS